MKNGITAKSHLAQYEGSLRICVVMSAKWALALSLTCVSASSMGKTAPHEGHVFALAIVLPQDGQNAFGGIRFIFIDVRLRKQRYHQT